MSATYLMMQLDLNKDVEAQIRALASIHQARTGHWPESILLNPKIVARHPLADLKIKIECLTSVPPYLAYTGPIEGEMK